MSPTVEFYGLVLQSLMPGLLMIVGSLSAAKVMLWAVRQLRRGM